MNETAGILLVADDSVHREFVAELGPGSITHHTDPYDALVDMGRRAWETVVIAGPRADFAGLLRASRRLQQDARLLGLCSPAAEPEVRPLAGEVMDDYLIFPPTPGELAELVRRPAAVGAASQAPGAPGRDLSPQDLASLVSSASSVSALELHVAELVGERLGVPVVWTDADEVGLETRTLLLAPGQGPRALVARNGAPEPDGAAKRFLDAVQQCLPALFETANRAESLHRLAITDHLTGAFNRRYFYHVTGRVLLRSRQNGGRVALLLYDFDDFKRYNDTYGHAAGDEILRDTAAMMKHITRAHDVVARIGGDEFAVLFWDPGEPRLPGSRPVETAQALTDRFREGIRQHAFTSLGPEAKGVLTISGGLASFPRDGQTCRELLRAADAALKKAKCSGKNNIRLIGTD